MVRRVPPLLLVRPFRFTWLGPVCCRWQIVRHELLPRRGTRDPEVAFRGPLATGLRPGIPLPLAETRHAAAPTGCVTVHIVV